MKKYLVLILAVLLWAFAFFVTSNVEAKPRRVHTPYIGYRTHKTTPYWRVKRRTASGTHTYQRAGWPREYACAGMYNKTPIKDRAVKRYKFYKPRRR